MSRRIQGRPTRGEGDVGRERLIEATRDVLRRVTPPDVSRKAVAAAAGVTPALVSYYFPSKASLLQAATGPLLQQRVTDLLAILDGPGERADKLNAIVHLLVNLNEVEANLIDAAIAICVQPAAHDAPTPLALAYGRLRRFYLEGVQAQTWRALDADVFLFALWGMCKFAARTWPMPARGGHDLLAATVIDLITNGIGRA